MKQNRVLQAVEANVQLSNQQVAIPLHPVLLPPVAPMTPVHPTAPAHQVAQDLHAPVHPVVSQLIPVRRRRRKRR